MAVNNFKRHYVVLAETFKKFNSKGYAHLIYPIIVAKQQFEKKPGILFSERKTKVQYSSVIHEKKQVWCFLSQELNVPQEDLHYGASVLPLKGDKNITDVRATLDFLRQYGFENSVIAESVLICFYPIEVIQEGLQQIAKNEDKLSRFGLVGGFTKTECKFTHGSMVKDKRLQLCLYYANLSLLDNDVWKISKSKSN